MQVKISTKHCNVRLVYFKRRASANNVLVISQLPSGLYDCIKVGIHIAKRHMAYMLLMMTTVGLLGVGLLVFIIKKGNSKLEKCNPMICLDQVDYFKMLLLL